MIIHLLDVVSILLMGPPTGSIAQDGEERQYHTALKSRQFIPSPGVEPALAQELTEADIGGVYTVSRYNAETQDLTWRMPGVGGENFPVRAGYPYIVCVDETAAPTWP